MSFLEYAKAYGFIKYEQFKNGVNGTPNSQLSNQQQLLLTSINTDGIVVIPNYYNSNQCDRITRQIDEMIEDDEITKWVDDAKSDSRVYASHLHSEDILKFHNDPFLKKIGEAYTENELINSHTLAGRIISKNDNLGSGGGWHRDSVFPVQYKSIIYLSDVNPKNGPFEYILGSHKKSTILKSIIENKFVATQNRMTTEQVDDFSFSNPELKRKIFTAKKGSLILVDTSGIHRGMPIEQGERYALTNYFFLKHQYTQKARAKFEKWF
jgi:hypothetical protein